MDRRFGYPNEEALACGQTGTACRGEEHDVVIVWSITSGKRQIMMDGREVHYSTNRTNVLEHSWTSRGNHIVKVLCHATLPLSAAPGFRQYDLFIDGQSFFTMPKMYELGLRSGSRDNRVSGPRSALPPPAAVKAPRSAQEEQEDLQKAIKASLEESRAHLEQKSMAPPPPVAAPAPPAVPDGDDLMSLGMGDPTVPAGYDSVFGASASQPYQQAPAYQQQVGYQQPPIYEEPSAYQQQPAYQQPTGTPAYPTSNAGSAAYPALPASTATAQDPAYYPPPPAPAPYMAPPTTPSVTYATPAASPPQTGTVLPDTFTPNPSGPADLYDTYAAEDPFAPRAAPPATHSQVTNEILSEYMSPAPATGAQPAGLATPGGAGQALANGDTPGSAAMIKFEDDEPSNPFDAALKKLVNVDHIDQPAEVHLAVKKKEEESEKMRKKGKSKGLPPAAHQVVGGQATLDQISEVKSKKEPKEDIMKAPPQLFSAEAQQAGMMVVYGQPAQQGPPPLQKPQGFGVGYPQQAAYPVQPGYAAQPGYSQPPPAYY